MRKNEKVGDFCERFESLIREFENCADATPFTEQEKRGAFFRAVKDVAPEIKTQNISYKSRGEREMTYDELKSFLFQLEATQTEVRSSEVKPAANVASGLKENQCSEDDKCYRCNKTGHWKGECPLKPSEKWNCSNCGQDTNHKSKNCPLLQKFRGKNRNFNKIKGQGGFKNSNQNKGNGKGGKRGGKEKMRGVNGNKPGKIGKKQKFKNKSTNNQEQGGMLQYIDFSNKLNNSNEITFIADTGATEHIINKGLILSNFEKSRGEVIKCANKNKSANIKIDGRGDLLLTTNNGNNIRLTNVLVANEVAENLISLRHFVEAGLSIRLDDKTLKIYDETSGYVYLSGIYDRPNWLIKMSVENIKNNIFDYDEYQCKARIVSLEDFIEQSNNDFLNLESSNPDGGCFEDSGLSTSEGVSSNLEKEDPCEVGRENEERVNQSESLLKYFDWNLS